MANKENSSTSVPESSEFWVNMGIDKKQGQKLRRDLDAKFLEKIKEFPFSAPGTTQLHLASIDFNAESFVPGFSPLKPETMEKVMDNIIISHSNTFTDGYENGSSKEDPKYGEINQDSAQSFREIKFAVWIPRRRLYIVSKTIEYRSYANDEGKFTKSKSSISYDVSLADEFDKDEVEQLLESLNW